jgi:superfamily I DNA/RNA helicase
MDFLDKLNPEQRKAVTAGGGPVLVLAGPGSGKTRVLTQRVAYLIAQEGVRPYRILAVTFTNKAAREMQTRVEKLLGSDATQGMMLGTFHSICARLLRREAENLSIGSNFVIFDADDQERIVKGIIRELNLSEKLYRPASVHAAISSAKNELIEAGNYPITNYRDEVVKRVYIEYQKRLVASNAVDFDDLLMYTAHLLEDNPAVREKYARRFEQVLVDEFQDTNLAQYTLLKHLASAHHNIFVVGDPDQCFPAGTTIHTPDGEKSIETFRAGDSLLAASGLGLTMSKRVSRVGKQYFTGALLKVVTRGGSSFRATLNHLTFVYDPGREAPEHGSIRLNQMQPMNVAAATENLDGNARGFQVASGLFLVEGPQSVFTPRYNVIPARHLHPGMMVAVAKNNQIIEDEIESISCEQYDGYVYDLEVDQLHNYLAGGIVVHNSIYRWRGADWRNVQRFEQDFPDAQVILLEQNYRSRQTILDAAMGVINRAPNRRRKRLFSDRGGGEKIYYYEAPDDYSEASFVVDSIAQLVASRDFEPGECAVMYRTNAQSRLLEEAFLQARLPYRLVGAQRFYGRREIKDLIAFLRLVHNPADEASLERVINVPPRGIGDKTLVTLRTAAHQSNTAAGLVLLDLARGAESSYWNHFSARSVIALADFGGSLAGWNAAAPALGVPELFDLLVRDLNYKAYVDDESEEGVDRWENVQELRRLALEYSTRTLDEFLENVALVADQDTIQDNVNAPTLLTLHAAKGLEFGAVFIVGLDDGILPHSRSFDEPEQMEEERRLFYVGITRAKDRLYLLRAIQRGGRGYAEETFPSRFLEDVPEGLLVGKSRTGRGLHDRAGESLWAASVGTARSAPVMDPKFRAGIRVKHPMWGEGIVLNSRLQDGDEILEVVFESVGIKRLSASLANLMVI